MTEITKDRYQVLHEWYEREWQNFTSETSFTVAAVADIQATGSELDMLAMWLREARGETDAAIEGQATLDDLEQDLKDDPAEPATGIVAPDLGPVGDGQDSKAHTGSEEPPADAGPPAALSTELVHVRELSTEEQLFELDQRRAKAYALSGYWRDARELAQALVKIEAGRSLEIPEIVAMSDIYVIEGKPVLGAGIQAALVRRSGFYDYRVHELSGERCEIEFFETAEGTSIGVSVFTIEDAKAAGLLAKKGESWTRYPRNMLFSRAMTNGVGWYCPDVLGGRWYGADELD